MDTTTDLLLDGAAQRHRQALDELLVRYLPQLHSFVRARLLGDLRAREASVDVVQSVCRELIEGGSRFDFRGEDRFRAWLFTAALNKIRERHRRLHAARRDLAREQSPVAPEAIEDLAHLVTPSQEAVGSETAAAIAAALAALSEEHREVITLARLVHLPHGVIAEVLGRSEAATRQLLARAMVRLVDELERRGVDVAGWLGR